MVLKDCQNILNKKESDILIMKPLIKQKKNYIFLQKMIQEEMYNSVFCNV